MPKHDNDNNQQSSNGSTSDAWGQALSGGTQNISQPVQRSASKQKVNQPDDGSTSNAWGQALKKKDSTSDGGTQNTTPSTTTSNAISTSQGNTELNPSQEKSFQQWKDKLPSNLQNDEDYDLRGLYKNNPTQQPSARLHFPDTYKKPNHITFSDESVYSNEQNKGGHWQDEGKGKYTFYASEQNVKNAGGADKLQEYFKNKEPNSKLVLPQPTSQENVINNIPPPKTTQTLKNDFSTYLQQNLQYLKAGSQNKISPADMQALITQAINGDATALKKVKDFISDGISKSGKVYSPLDNSLLIVPDQKAVEQGKQIEANKPKETPLTTEQLVKKYALSSKISKLKTANKDVDPISIADEFEKEYYGGDDEEMRREQDAIKSSGNNSIVGKITNISADAEIVKQNKNYRLESTGLDALYDYANAEYADLKKQYDKAPNGDLKKQLDDKAAEITKYSDQYNDLYNKYPQVAQQQFNRVIKDNIAANKTSLLPHFYTSQSDIDDAVKRETEADPNFATQFSKQIQGLKDNTSLFQDTPIGTQGIVDAIRRGTVGVGRDIYSWFLSHNERAALNESSKYKASDLPTSFAASNYSPKIIIGKDGKTFLEAKNDLSTTFNSGVNFIGEAAPGILEFAALEEAGAGLKVGNLITKGAKLATGLSGELAESIAGVDAIGTAANMTNNFNKLGTTGLSIANKINKGIGLVAAQYGTSFIKNYDDAYAKLNPKTAADFGNVKTMAHLYTLSEALAFKAMGLTPNEIIKGSLRESVGKDIYNFLTTEDLSKITPEQLSKKMYSTWKDKIPAILKASGIEAAKMGGINVIQQGFKDAINKAFDPNIKASTPDEYIDAFKSGAALGGVFGLFGNLRNYKNISPATGDVLYSLGMNSDKYNSVVDKGVQDGTIPQDRAIELKKIINTSAESVNDVKDKLYNDGTPLKDIDKIKISKNNFRTAFLDNLEKDDNNKQKIEEQKNAIKKEDDDILNSSLNKQVSININPETLQVETIKPTEDEETKNAQTKNAEGENAEGQVPEKTESKTPVDFSGKDNNFLANKEPEFFTPEERVQYNELMKTDEGQPQAADMVNKRKEDILSQSKTNNNGESNEEEGDKKANQKTDETGDAKENDVIPQKKGAASGDGTAPSIKVGDAVTTKDGKKGEVAEIKDGQARVVKKGSDESGALPTQDLGWHDLNELNNPEQKGDNPPKADTPLPKEGGITHEVKFNPDTNKFDVVSSEGNVMGTYDTHDEALKNSDRLNDTKKPESDLPKTKFDNEDGLIKNDNGTFFTRNIDGETVHYKVDDSGETASIINANEYGNVKGSNGEPPEEPAIGTQAARNEWVGIQKSMMSEKVMKVLGKLPATSWGSAIGKAIDTFADMAKQTGKTIIESSKEYTDAWHDRIFDKDEKGKTKIGADGKPKIKERVNLTDEQLAGLAVRKTYLADLLNNTDNVNEQQKVLDEMNKVDEVLRVSQNVAGASFNFLQSVYKVGDDGKIKYQRNKLGNIIDEPIPENEKDLNSRVDELNELGETGKAKNLQDAYAMIKDLQDKLKKAQSTTDANIDKINKDDFDKAIKEAEQRGRQMAKDEGKKGEASLTIEKRKSIAEGLRKFAENVEKFGKAKGAEGAQGAGIDIQKMAADAMRYIADKIEEGKLKIPDIIADAIAKYGDKDSEDELRGMIKKELSNAGVDKELSSTKGELAVDKINDLKEKEKATTITPDMVKKGLIKDFVENNLGKGLKAEEILDKAHEDLKKILPDVTKRELLDAYTKKGEYTPQSREEVETELKQKTDELRKTANLQRDIDLLNSGEIILKDKSKRKEINSEVVKRLTDEKNALLDERKKVIREEKNAKTKSDKLKDIQNRIDDATNRQKLWDKVVKSTTSGGTAFDKMMADKKAELDATLINNGIKLDRSGGNEIQKRRDIANLHNTSIDNLIEEIKGQPLPKGTIKTLQDLKIKDVNSSEDLDSKLKKAEGKIQTAINTLGRITQNDRDLRKKLVDIRRELSDSRRDNNEAIALKKAKQKLQSDTNKLRRDTAAGNFEPAERKTQPQIDREYIKLEYERNQAQADFDRKKDALEYKNKSFMSKLGAMWLKERTAGLISSVINYIKLPLAALDKIVADPITNNITTWLAPKWIEKATGLSKATERTRISWKAEKEGYKTTFFHTMTGDKVVELLKETDANLKSATDNYFTTADKANDIKKEFGEKSKEYKKFMKGDYQKALQQFDDAGLESSLAFVHQFTGNVWENRLQQLTSGASDFEQGMGDFKRMTYADRMAIHSTKFGKAAEGFIYTVDYMGRLHAATKDISAMKQFMEGYTKRIEKAIENKDAGQPLTESEKWVIMAKSYDLDFKGGKYAEANRLAEWLSVPFKAIDEKFNTKLGTTVAQKVIFPVLKIPLNIENAALFKYTLGFPMAITRMAGEAVKTWKYDRDLKEGFLKDASNFGELFRKHMSQLDPVYADKIVEGLNKGFVGMATMAWAYHAASTGKLAWGGVYVPGGRKVIDDYGNQLDYGQFSFDGHVKSPLFSKVIGHMPETMPIIMAINTVQAEKKRDNANEWDELHDKPTTAPAWAAFTSDLTTAYNEGPLSIATGDINGIANNIIYSFASLGAARDIGKILDGDTERENKTYRDKILLNFGLRFLVNQKDQQMNMGGGGTGGGF